jgi:hypothetical protein
MVVKDSHNLFTANAGVGRVATGPKAGAPAAVVTLLTIATLLTLLGGGQSF